MYLYGTISDVVELTPSVRLYEIKLYERISASPGQFLMLWVPRIGEIPLSIANLEDRGLWLIIAKKGRVTTFIHENFDRGTRVFLRGPLGRGFSVKKEFRKCLLVAGGYGLAPLYFLARQLKDCGITCDALLGFKSVREMFFVDEFKGVCTNVYVSTDDGSYGFKGLVTDLLDTSVTLEAYDAVYTSGKELMMLEVVNRCSRRGIHVEASLERLIKCGVGICGLCSLDPLGLRVCKDGPIFTGEVLLKLRDFGRYWRDEHGRKKSIEER
ncbi:MAG: dihydroorotate dehydrogenase electron transfer subunit [Thermoprotei archaeon]|nr:MAG: dihydroorotate dehydrogenase electron transfer subunit [Thermoprotei archaeon]